LVGSRDEIGVQLVVCKNKWSLISLCHAWMKTANALEVMQVTVCVKL